MKSTRFVGLLLMCMLAWSASLLAQDRVNVYPDNRMLWSEMMLHAEQGLIREGRDWRGNVLWTTRPGELFEGYSSSAFDLKFTVRDGHLIQGDSNFSDAILYTLDGHTIYIGDSTFPLDLVYTLQPDALDPSAFGLYKEDSISMFDRICVFEGKPTPEVLFGFLLALGLL
ncbi:hypothetical protein N8802_02235 [Flavobacteriales bacterium]|jgi:hypothetical protein|nr:hypothetical protein [Flavobacteriales bacterium]MDB4795904.1 hypothetical protein [Flavobacteriales bacterium]